MFSEINSGALIEKWENIKKKPVEMCKITLNRSIDAYHRDDTLHYFLTFLKLFPAHRSKFERSVDSLIVFSDVSEKKLIIYFPKYSYSYLTFVLE